MIILPHLPHILAQVRLVSVKPLLGCLAAPSDRLGPCLVVPHGVRAIPFANSCCDFTPFTQGPWMNHLGPTDLQHLWSITSKKHLCLLPFQPLTHRAGGNLLQGTSITSSWVLQLLFFLPRPLISPIQGPRTVSVPLLGAARQPKRSLCSPVHRSSSAAVPAVSSSQPKARRSIPTESFHHEATKTPQVSPRGSPRPKGRLTETPVSHSVYCKTKSDPTDSRARRSPPRVRENRYPQPSPGSKPLERARH